jgi:ElaB/YqjD/DUF883 family membrane-anchored ribosome-binding protein
MAEGIGGAPVSRIGGENAVMEGPLVGAARTVEATARKVKDRVVEVKDQLAQKSVGELMNDGREYVRENPGKAILIAVGVGALAGYLIGRRRS